MTTLADFTCPGLIVPELRSRDAMAVLEELCALLWREGRVPDQHVFRKMVIEREQRCATVIEPGWALPHSRSNGLPQLAFALGRMSRPLAWLGSDANRVHLVFLFAVPESQATAYLHLIAGLARLSEDSVRLQRLRQAPTARALFDVLSGIPLSAGPSPTRQQAAEPAGA